MTETSLEIQKNEGKDRYEVRTFFGKKKESSTTYYNILEKNPVKIAQVLIDLEFIENFPIEKAVAIYLQKKKKGDWLSLV